MRSAVFGPACGKKASEGPMHPRYSLRLPLATLASECAGWQRSKETRLKDWKLKLFPPRATPRLIP
jgi:hypothetical protein